ncbi:universal stress protein [Cyanobacteria bacterium FACHB-DQ100]|uniref:universal stress protein n=1 Tax=Leptolyngbya sp. DQ-M1 TaxID=2933920 RepID=UPI001990E1E6|nr:universal stress protein [Cyanobacteria bacterium FACHB-DQ100]
MFQKILAVLDPTQSCHCVLTTALSYARANQAQIRLITSSEDKLLIEAGSDAYIDIAQLVEQTDQALVEAAQLWNADLIVTARALNPELQRTLPCSVLIVRQDDQTISITMQLKPLAPNLEVRSHLERLLALTPSL